MTKNETESMAKEWKPFKNALVTEEECGRSTSRRKYKNALYI
jgi:hypothetical protein